MRTLLQRKGAVALWITVLCCAFASIGTCTVTAQVVPVGLQDMSISHLAAEQGDAEQGWFPGTANLLFAAVQDNGIYQGYTWYDGGEWRSIGPRYDRQPEISALGVQHWGYGPMDGMYLFAALNWSEHGTDSTPVLLRHEFHSYGAPAQLGWMPADSGLSRGSNAPVISSMEAFYFSGHTPPQPVLAWSTLGPLKGQTAGRYWEELPFEQSIAVDMDAAPQWFGDHLWAAGALVGVRIQPAVFRSRDKGASWSILRPDAPRESIAHSVSICPSHPDTVWIGMGSYVLRTMDGGTNWTSLLQMDTGNVIGLESDPMYPGTIYAAGSGPFELYRSSDFGDSWRRIHPGAGPLPGPITCTTVALMDSLPMSRLPRFGLFMGTSATGIWVYDMLFSPTDIHDFPSPEHPALTVYPNPVRDVMSVDLTLLKRSEVTIDIVDILGRVVKRVEYGLREQGRYVFSIMTHDLIGGVYLLRTSDHAVERVLVDR